MFIIKDLYEKYKQDVFIYLMSITHDKTLSEDLVSETFLSAIRSLPNFKGKSTIKTWLFSIARHKWHEYLREKKESTSIDLFVGLYISEDLSPEKMLTRNETTRRIFEILEKEDRRTKGIVMMRIDGYSFYEISRKFEISEGSARVINFRAKKKLREILTEEGYHYE